MNFLLDDKGVIHKPVPETGVGVSTEDFLLKVLHV